MFHIVKLANVHHSATVATERDLNRNSCDSEAEMAVFLLKTLLYVNNLPSLPNWNRIRVELILYWRVCYPDVSHGLRGYTFHQTLLLTSEPLSKLRLILCSW